MPTVVLDGPYRLHFWSADRREPPHVHVERDRKTAKFWLQPVRLDKQRHFGAAELRGVKALVRKHEQAILREWHDRFGR